MSTPNLSSTKACTILFISGNRKALEHLHNLYGYPLLIPDNETSFGSGRLLTKKGEAVLALVSFCNEAIGAIPSSLAKHARQLLDEAAISFDPHEFGVRTEKNYLKVADDETYQWHTFDNYGWAKSWPKGVPGNPPHTETPSVGVLAFDFFSESRREDSPLSKALERSASLYRKSRTSGDHFVAFTLMYIALEALLASDVLQSGESIFVDRALKLIVESERSKMKVELEACCKLRNDLIHRAGGERNRPKIDSTFEPCTETLRVLFHPVFAFLCLRTKEGCEDLPNAWHDTPQDSLLISFERAHSTIAITGVSLTLSDRKNLSASPTIKSLLSAQVRAPARQYGPHSNTHK
jgi:hypothetical protein